MNAHRVRAASWAVVLAGLALRAAFLWAVPNQQWSDTAWYESAARTLAATGELRFEGPSATYRAWFPPAWPAFLAVFHWLLGPAPWVVKAVNLALSGIALAGTVALGRRVLGDVEGVVAGALLGLLPGQICYVALAQYEVFLTATLVMLLITVARASGPRAARSTASAHVVWLLLAVAVMTRPPLIGFALLVAILPCLRPGGVDGRRISVVAAVWVLAPALLWTGRNAVVLGDPIPFDTHSGYNAWLATRPEADGGVGSVPDSRDPLVNLAALDDEVLINRRGWDLAAQRVRESPGAYLALTPRRVAALYSTDTTSLYLAFLRAPMVGPGLLDRWRSTPLPEQITFRAYALVMILAAVGAFRVDWHSPDVRLWAALVLYVTAVAALTFGTDRFHAPVMPAFCLFAAAATGRSRLAARVA